MQDNATIEVFSENGDARIFRVYPDDPKLLFTPGQYGSIGLESLERPGKLVKRAFSISGPIVDLQTGQWIDMNALPFYEVYVNRVELDNSAKERLSPRLFELKDGDRIHYGRKIVGHYSIEDADKGKNVLLIGIDSGEAPNNAILTSLLANSWPANIHSMLCYPKGRESLYLEKHRFAASLRDTYTFSEHYYGQEGKMIDVVEQMVGTPRMAEDLLGFAIDPDSCHVFICGDPTIIGPAKRLGGWAYEDLESGVLKTLTQARFKPHTKFQEGNFSYETYW